MYAERKEIQQGAGHGHTRSNKSKIVNYFVPEKAIISQSSELCYQTSITSVLFWTALPDEIVNTIATATVATITTVTTTTTVSKKKQHCTLNSRT